MKSKSLVWLAAVFLALALVVGLLAIGDDGSSSSQQSDDPLGVGDYSASSTSRVSIKPAGMDLVTLEKADGDWRVAGKPANAEQVDAFFTQLSKLDDASLASKNPDNHERLGLAKQQATRIVLTRDGDELVVLIGQPSGPGGGFYAKREGADEAWEVVSADLLSTLAQDAKAWRTAPASATSMPVGGAPAPGPGT
jgi:hypothetical protein